MRTPQAAPAWWGLGAAGVVLLAAAAFAAGALPGADPALEIRQTGLLGAPARYLTGLGAWLAGSLLLIIAWWQIGAGARCGALTTRRLVVAAALAALPLLVAPPMGSRDVYAYACHGALVLDGHDPYEVGAAAGCPWADAVPPLWRDTPAPYGPFAVALSTGAAALARALPADPDRQLLVAVGLLRAVALVGVGLLIGYGTRLAARLSSLRSAPRSAPLPEPARRQPTVAVWLGAATPLVAIHAVSGAHNDALVAGLVVAGLSVAAGRRPADGWALSVAAGRGPDGGSATTRAALLAGALLGLATAVKVTALVAAPFAVLLAASAAWPPQARRGPAVAPAVLARVGALVFGAGALTFAALSAGTGLGLGWVGALGRTGSLVQWTSLPTGLGMAAGYALRVLGRPEAFEEAVAVARGLGLAALAAVLALLWWRAWRGAAGPRGVVIAAGAAMAATAVLGPVLYPWYALAPLAVLAASTMDDRARRLLAAATAVLALLVLPFGLGLAVLTKLPGALLDVLAVIAAAVWWWRRRRAGPTTPIARA